MFVRSVTWLSQDQLLEIDKIINSITHPTLSPGYEIFCSESHLQPHKDFGLLSLAEWSLGFEN